MGRRGSGDGDQGRSPWGLAQHLAGNFDLASAEKLPGFGGGARRTGVGREKLAVGAIHGVEIAEVGEVDFDPDHVFAGEIQFLEYVSDGGEHRAGFGGDIAEHGKAGGKVSSDQSGEEGVVLIQYHLAEGRPRCGNGTRLDSR